MKTIETYQSPSNSAHLDLKTDAGRLGFCNFQLCTGVPVYLDFHQVQRLRDRLTEWLDSPNVKCSECGGRGKCDDAGFGDIFYNEWTCPKCDGTGAMRTATSEQQA